MASAAPTTSAAQPTLDALQALIHQHKDNLTALSTIRAPSFVESSDFRGTTDILYSCVVTLVACIYTALHLNVPTKSGLGHAVRSKGKWVFIGLIAPELVLYLAIAQFLQARKLVKALNALLERDARRGDLEAGAAKEEVGKGKDALTSTDQPLDKRPAPELVPEQPLQESYRNRQTGNDLTNGVASNISGTSGLGISRAKHNDDNPGSQEIKENEIPKFDLKYGFFVVMGGIEVPVHDIEPILTDAIRGGQFSGRLRLTPEGVLQLAEDGYFLEIPRSKIDDKSKADTISKILVMIQVAWMAMQCITRKAYGLPLALLEVHTMVHVICAVLLFVLWIDKPKDVQDPELVDISGFEDIIALMYQESYLSPGKCTPSWGSFIPLGASLMLYPPLRYGTHGELVVSPEEADPSTWFLKPGYRFPFGFGFAINNSGNRRIHFGTSVSAPGHHFRNFDITRWKRIISAVERKDGPIRVPCKYIGDGNRVRYPHCNYHEAFPSRPGNIRQTKNADESYWRMRRKPRDLYKQLLDPSELVNFIMKSKLLLALILMLPLVYGGVHLAAFNFEFPSPPESLTWKIASIYTMAALPVMIVTTFLFELLEDWVIIFLDLNSTIETVVEFLGTVPSLTIMAGYILARTYLVVESFVSLRAEPVGVFWTPAWLQMIPHL